MRVVPTFLGAHTVPPEYRERRADYVDLLIEEMLPSFVGEEALTAATLNGARALEETIGSIEVGKRCELALRSINDHHEIGYHFSTNLIHSLLALR